MLRLGNPGLRRGWVRGRLPDPVIASPIDYTGGECLETDQGALSTPSAQSALFIKTVLVIEPDRMTREQLVTMLLAQGLEVVAAMDGAAALRQARHTFPDLILSAVQLPEMDGYELLQRIRQDEQLMPVPFIFLTHRSSRSEIRQGMNAGADDYLTKPVEQTELMAAIRACLSRRARSLKPYKQQVQRSKLVLERIAYWDEVTGLPNRRMFGQQLQGLVGQAQRTQENVALFCLSVDQLHTITITFGQEIGTALLQAVSQRLKQVEALSIARLGDTEFGLIFADAWQHQQVAQVAQRLVDVVSQPYRLNGHEVRIQVSVGVASYPQHGMTPDNLMMQANTAMRWCQQHGQNGYRFYNPTMSTIESERHLIATDLGRAIERSELAVYYQPQIDVQTGEMTGVEALIRWRHSRRGMISPATFIPIAEELGLIVPIGEWVLRTACEEFQQLQRQVPRRLKLAVNLSMRQLQQGNFLEMIEQILQETQIDPASLQLELTESCLMKQVNTTIYTLQQLKQMGLAISIDDFGTGYSSLTYLSKLPIDTLKIDHTFVSQLTVDKNAAVISNTIIDMAQRLNLDVIAEGVETHSQLMFLHQLGCQSVQGFLYSPPLTAAETLAFIQDRKPTSMPMMQREMIKRGSLTGEGRSAWRDWPTG